MPNNIKGFSVLMNLRDVNVERTLKQIKGQFKTLSSEMSRSTSNFKHSEKSMQSFSKRAKELKKGIDVTEKSMEEISNRLKKMTVEEQRTSAEAEKLRLEYSRQHKALGMYQRQLQKTENEMKQFTQTNKKTLFSMEKINVILGTMKKQLNIADMAFQRSTKSVKSYDNYLKQLNVVIGKHQNTIRVLEGRYKKVVAEQGKMSKEALELKEKILQEKQSLQQLNAQYRQTSAEAKRFSFEQKSATQSMSEIRQKITQVAQSLQVSASKFKLSGQTAKAYKARISELNNDMKQQTLIVQNLSRQYDYAKKQYGSTSVEAQKLNAKLVEEKVKLKELNSQLKQTTQEHNRLKMEQQKGISSISEIRHKMTSFNDTLALSRSNLARAGESVRSYKNHLNTLNTNMKQQRTVLRELTTQYKFVASEQGKNSAEARELSSAITQQKIRMNELETEIKQTVTNYKKLSIEQQKAQALGATGFGRAMQGVNKYNDSIKNVGMQMRSIGTGAMVYMAMPSIAAMTGAIKSSIDWEQAMAGVAKTTDMTGKELDKMGSEITNMSNKMPFAATEIAGVAEAAGQLGVKKKDITKFTKTMMDMSVATNLTADEAATEFARFANAAGMPIKDVDRLGAAVVNLGNSTATTEKEIVEMGQRLAGAGAQAGFSGDQIMSISAAMSSVGINAEAGGTAMTQIFNKMTKATASGGDKLNSFAKVAGMSAQEFASTWEKNPTKALSTFVKGLGDTEGGAKGVLKALDNVGIKGIREADTIRRLSNNHKVLDEALKTGAEGWKENTALTNEASIRYETMGSKLKMLRNTFINLLRSLGDAFAPIIIKISDALTGLFKKLQGASDTTKILITSFLVLTATIGPLLITGGLLLTLLANFAKSMIFLNSLSAGGGIFAGLKVAFSKLLSPITQIVSKIPLIGGSLTALSGPIGWISAGIVALGVGFAVAYAKSETFRKIVNNAIHGVMNTFKTAKTAIQGFFQLFKGNGQDGVITLSKILPPDVVVGLTNFADTVKRVFFQVVNAIKNFGIGIGQQLSVFWKQNGAEITQAVKNIAKVISTVFNFIWSSVIKPIMTLIWNLMKLLWPAIKALIVSVWNNIKGVIKGALDIILGTVKIFSSLFTGNWKGVWQGIEQVTSGAVKFLWNLVQLWFVGKILKVVKLFGSLLRTSISGIWKGIKLIFDKSLGSIWRLTKSIFSKLFNSIKSIFTRVKNFLSKIWTNIKTFIVKTATNIWTSVRTKFTNLYKSVKSIFTSIKNFGNKIWSNLKKTIVNLVQSLWKNVKNIFTKLYGSIKSIFNNTFKFSRNLWTKLRNTIKNLANSVWNNVKNIFTRLWNSVKSIFNRIFNFSRNTWTKIKKSVISLANGAKNGVVSGFKAMYDKGKSWINKLKGFITGSKEKFKSAALSLGKSAANGAIGGLNKMIGGINKISKAITDKTLIKKIPKLHTGTKGAITAPTPAIVNDKGSGNGSGAKGHQELIAKKDGSLHAPVGRNVLVGLDKGDSVINGRHTQSLIKEGMIPKFHGGKNSKKKKDSVLDQAKSWTVDKGAEFGAGVANTVHSGLDTGKKAVKKGVSAAKDGASWLGDKIGDVWDYVKHPGKLVNKMLDGISFGGKKANATMRMAGLAFNKIKKSLVGTVKSWFEEAEGGDGDASWLFKHDIWQKFGAYTGGLGFNGGQHYGMDFGMKPGTPVKAVAGGKVSRVWNDYGGGKSIEIALGKGLTNWYMHLNEQLVKKGQRVSAGDLIAKSGNTGNYTAGSGHLYFQLNKNGVPKDPEKWLRNLTGGGSKSASKWKPEVKKALALNGLPTSAKYVNAWIKQIDTESSGNPKAMGGNDGLLDGNAKGLVQVKPGTFMANKFPGMGNIWNPLHNLAAGIRYAHRKYGNGGLGVIGKGHGYATGGLINTPGWYNLAEQGHGEWIIPRDPSRRNDAMKLLALAANDVKSSNNKRPNQMTSPKNINRSGEDTSLLLRMIEKQEETINALKASVELLAEIAAKDYEPVIDKYEHEQQIFNGITKYERTKKRTGKYRPAH